MGIPMDKNFLHLVRLFSTGRYILFSQTIPYILTKMQESVEGFLNGQKHIEGGKLNFSVNAETALGAEQFKQLCDSEELGESARMRKALRKISRGDVSVYHQYCIEPPQINNVVFDFHKIEEANKKIIEAIASATYADFCRVIIFYMINQKDIRAIFRRYAGRDALGNADYQAAVRQFTKLIKTNVPEVEDDERQDAALVLCMLCGFGNQDNNEDTIKETLRNDGRSFEEECHAILVDNGFDVRLTPISGDYGIDIIAQNDNLNYAIQCKSGMTPAGTNAVQEAIAGRKFYMTDFSVVVAESGFTQGAKEMAARDDVILVYQRSLKSIDILAANLP
jgi:hypothetical protein